MQPRKLRIHAHDDLPATKVPPKRGPRQRDVRPLPTLLNITMLADHLGVTPRYVRRLIAEERIPYLKLGRLVRFDPDEIAEWLESARKKAAAPRPGIAAKRGGRRSDGQAG
jgi:excisionase family DNA binding protein